VGNGEKMIDRVTRLASKKTGAARLGLAGLLLAIYCLAGELAPVVHVSTHRPDHTHGPGTRTTHHHTHAAIDLHPNGHGQELDERAPYGNPASDAGGSHSPDDLGSVPRDSRAPADPEHGTGSILHFDLALIDEPTPQPLPTPGEAVVAPLILALSWTALASVGGEPTRGPPIR
jgi:hypothetical protein